MFSLLFSKWNSNSLRNTIFFLIGLFYFMQDFDVKNIFMNLLISMKYFHVHI